MGVLTCVLALALGCQGSVGGPSASAPAEAAATADDPVWFRDDTEAVGLNFVQDSGPVGNYFFPQIMGSGAALLDYDNDGLYDLYFVQNAGPNSPSRNKLFHQRADGRFEDVSAGSGLDIAGYGMGVAVGDFDNDGFVDVYVSQYGGGRLFHNRRNGTFEDVTNSAGVELAGWGVSAAFFDYDRDGFLDLIVVQYVDYDPGLPCTPAHGQRDYCHPNNFKGTAARLFHNRGRDAKGRWLGFEDVTVKAGLARLGPGLGVTCADFDGDGWPDIFIANDSAANHLWINRHDGTFVEEAQIRGLAYNVVGRPAANMGVTLGDISGTGGCDVFVTHLTEDQHTLWRQSRRGFYEDATVAAGLAGSPRHGTGFGTILLDFDLDGALDLAIVNGRVARTFGQTPDAPGLDHYWAAYAERNQLFSGDGNGTFREISAGNKAFCGTYAINRGLVWADFDNDGLMDLVVTTVAGPARFYRNIAARKGHWLIVRSLDPALHRDAYGAVITLQAPSRRWVGLINPAQSYLCSGDPRAHFGLGPVTTVDQIQVSWPDGMAEVFPGGVVDRVITLKRGDGRKVAP